jgi:hypothetical protein
MAMDIRPLLNVCRALSRKPDSTRPRLVTVGFSHFCEKARWALDLSPLASGYYEEVHCPAMHLSSTLHLSNYSRVLSWDTSSPYHKLLVGRHESKIGARKEKTAIPKLVLPRTFVEAHPTLHALTKLDKLAGQDDSGSVIVYGGSAGILKLLSTIYPRDVGHLHPAGATGDSVVEVEHMLDTVLAPAVTNWLFSKTLLTGTLYDPSASDSAINTATLRAFLRNCTRQDVPYVEKGILKVLGRRFIVPLMCKANGIHHGVAGPALANIHTVFQRMDELLAQHNPSGNVLRGFLLGTEAITAADITFAALAAPILLPCETNTLFSSLEDVSRLAGIPHSEGARCSLSLAQHLRSRYKSAQFVLDLYRYQRFKSAAAVSSTAGCPGRVVTLKTL